MKDFEANYKLLNQSQKQAVDTLEGPVLVVAGPGTGKTQLLSMRAANIVRKTDTPPESILCLTFTDAAAAEMRARLTKLMGPEGNKVSIHTFHSFGSEVINRFSEYFYNGMHFAPADEISAYQIMNEIFSDLPHSNPLSKTMNEEFAALNDASRAISHLKTAGLTPDELSAVLDANDKFYNKAEPILAEAFGDRLNKKDIEKFDFVMAKLNDIETPKMPVKNVRPIGDICKNQLLRAYNQSLQLGKTNPLTAWRNDWMQKDESGNLCLTDKLKAKKLRALVSIYSKYQKALTKKELFDFDDMITLVAHTMEQNDELRYNVQEQFLYVMVDEFQDTNGAQLRLLENILNNEVNEGRPNVLAVGDDDQAIYSFQGADVSNVLNMQNTWRDVKIITLTDNYRSTPQILQSSRTVIKNGQNRLEDLININKDLTAHLAGGETPALNMFDSQLTEYEWVATKTAELIASGHNPNQIAIIGRKHSQLIDILPYLHANKINLNYERRNNVIEQPHVHEVITTARVINAIAQQRFDQVEALLPELLSFKFWGIKTSALWQLSVKSYKERRLWLELMLEQGSQLKQVAEFLIVSSHYALHEPLDKMLDVIIGSQELQAENDTFSEPSSETQSFSEEEYVSPLRAYYFNEQRLKENPEDYMDLLNGLRAIRNRTRDRYAEKPLMLKDFIELIDLHIKTKTPIISTHQHFDHNDSVNLLTAHKSKGLEFKTVFVLSCQDEVWGRKTRNRSSGIKFPHNLPIEPAGSTYDDALRLFFVAMTRAKNDLILTAHKQNQAGKDSLIAEFLLDNFDVIEHSHSSDFTLVNSSPNWQERHFKLSGISMQEVLKPILESYKLSATHLNNFIDITRGGPQAFLLQNLLRFPQAMTRSQVFGQAIHQVLNRAHQHFAAVGTKRPTEDILHDFEVIVTRSRLNASDVNYLLEKGSDVLQKYLQNNPDIFSEHNRAERDFSAQNIVIDGVKLTGAIDLITIDKPAKSIVVTDYKTGKPTTNWRGATDFEKIKLHKYRQQLMLYKLLVENSNDLHGFKAQKGVLTFVEPADDGQNISLTMDFDDNELDRFKKLLLSVWGHIMQLELPDTSEYSQNYQGIIDFENWLIEQRN